MARDERLCKECESEEVEDVSHWLSRLGSYQGAAYNRHNTDWVASRNITNGTNS